MEAIYSYNPFEINSTVFLFHENKTLGRTAVCLLADISLFGRFLHCSDQDSPDPVFNYEVLYSCDSSVKPPERNAASAKISATSTKYIHLRVTVFFTSADC